MMASSGYLAFFYRTHRSDVAGFRWSQWLSRDDIKIAIRLRVTVSEVPFSSLGSAYSTEGTTGN